MGAVAYGRLVGTSGATEAVPWRAAVVGNQWSWPGSAPAREREARQPHMLPHASRLFDPRCDRRGDGRHFLQTTRVGPNRAGPACQYNRRASGRRFWLVCSLKSQRPELSPTRPPHRLSSLRKQGPNHQHARDEKWLPASAGMTPGMWRNSGRSVTHQGPRHTRIIPTHGVIPAQAGIHSSALSTTWVRRRANEPPPPTVQRSDGDPT